MRNYTLPDSLFNDHFNDTEIFNNPNTFFFGIVISMRVGISTGDFQTRSQMRRIQE